MKRLLSVVLSGLSLVAVLAGGGCLLPPSEPYAGTYRADDPARGIVYGRVERTVAPAAWLEVTLEAISGTNAVRAYRTACDPEGFFGWPNVDVSLGYRFAALRVQQPGLAPEVVLLPGPTVRPGPDANRLINLGTLAVTGSQAVAVYAFRAATGSPADELSRRFFDKPRSYPWRGLYAAELAARTAPASTNAPATE